MSSKPVGFILLKQKMRVFLIGYMGVGKTTIGKKLASRLSLKFIDLDHFIAEKEHLKVAHIIERKGEQYFRILEKKYLEEVCELENILVSTGGGTPCFFQNMDTINANGRSIFLKLDEKSLINRLVNSRDSRPLLAGKNAEELAVFIQKHLNERLPFYERAHLEFDMMHLNSKRLDDLENEIKRLELF